MTQINGNPPVTRGAAASSLEWQQAPSLKQLQRGGASVGLGSRGPAVLTVQQLLNAAGAEPRLVEDGALGRATLAAVRSFQQAQGLVVDGKAGRATLSSLRALVAQQQAAPELPPAHRTDARDPDRTAAPSGGLTPPRAGGALQRSAAAQASSPFNGRTFDPEIAYARLRGELEGLQNPAALQTALRAFAKGWRDGDVTQQKLFVIDYSLPSDQPRGWVIDLSQCKVRYHLKVAHGRGSGGYAAAAARFSNKPDSHATSVGAMVTQQHTKQSKFPGGKLVLRGLEQGFNDKAGARAVVMHGADYVASGGRSYGCPAVETRLAVPVMKYLENGAMLFGYGDDARWQRESTYIH